MYHHFCDFSCIQATAVHYRLITGGRELPVWRRWPGGWTRKSSYVRIHSCSLWMISPNQDLMNWSPEEPSTNFIIILDVRSFVVPFTENSDFLTHDSAFTFSLWHRNSHLWILDFTTWSSKFSSVLIKSCDFFSDHIYIICGRNLTH